MSSAPTTFRPRPASLWPTSVPLSPRRRRLRDVLKTTSSSLRPAGGSRDREGGHQGGVRRSRAPSTLLGDPCSDTPTSWWRSKRSRRSRAKPSPFSRLVTLSWTLRRNRIPGYRDGEVRMPPRIPLDQHVEHPSAGRVIPQPVESAHIAVSRADMVGPAFLDLGCPGLGLRTSRMVSISLICGIVSPSATWPSAPRQPSPGGAAGRRL